MQFIIIRFFIAPVMPAEDPLGIGIDDKAVMISGVKEHAIRRFRADAVNGQKAFANGDGIAFEHLLQAGAVLFNNGVYKCAESLGLDVEITCRANELCQLVVAEGVNFARSEHVSGLEVGNGMLHIFP